MSFMDLRECITAPEGHVLWQADFSSIEARVLAWLAGQDDLVARFAAGADVYLSMAGQIFGCPVRRSKKTDPPPVAAHLDYMRQIGKTAVLGCGYGMGVNKFEATYNVERALAEKAVATYRRVNSKIVAYWYAIEDAFKAVSNGRVTRKRVGLIEFHHEPDIADCVVRLPSGRCLFYHSVRIDGDGVAVFQPREKQWERTWGGALVENCVQAVSRDLLAEGIKRLEDAGHHVALTIHDAAYVVTGPNPDKEELLSLFTALPPWAAGCPVAAEAKIQEHI